MKLTPVVFLAAVAAVAAPAPVSKAIAVLHPVGASGVSGTVTFSRAEGGVKVSAQISGLSQGAHGFHIHEYGDCTAPDGTSAGGHFNPTGQPHAAPTADHRHTGDMGNVMAGKDGSATLEYVDTHASFEGENSILGRGVIVHEKADDLTTQPTGAAGARVACGVIGVAKAE
jgi:superoxide dismutase, Cu-Zn family